MEPIPREIKICELFDAGRLLLRSPERGEPDSPREFVEKLAPAGVPVAPVRTIAQAAEDPHLWQRQMLVETDDRKGGKTFVAGLTVKFSETPGAVGPIPKPGEHNHEVFCELLGHNSSELEAWRAEGVI